MLKNLPHRGSSGVPFMNNMFGELFMSLFNFSLRPYINGNKDSNLESQIAN